MAPEEYETTNHKLSQNELALNRPESNGLVSYDLKARASDGEIVVVLFSTSLLMALKWYETINHKLSQNELALNRPESNGLVSFANRMKTLRQCQ